MCGRQLQGQQATHCLKGGGKVFASAINSMHLNPSVATVGRLLYGHISQFLIHFMHPLQPLHPCQQFTRLSPICFARLWPPSNKRGQLRMEQQLRVRSQESRPSTWLTCFRLDSVARRHLGVALIASNCATFMGTTTFYYCYTIFHLQSLIYVVDTIQFSLAWKCHLAKKEPFMAIDSIPIKSIKSFWLFSINSFHSL